MHKFFKSQERNKLFYKAHPFFPWTLASFKSFSSKVEVFLNWLGYGIVELLTIVLREMRTKTFFISFSLVCKLMRASRSATDKNIRTNLDITYFYLLLHEEWLLQWVIKWIKQSSERNKIITPKVAPFIFLLRINSCLENRTTALSTSLRIVLESNLCRTFFNFVK